MPTDLVNAPVELGVLEELAGYHLRRASSAFANDFGRALAGTGMRQVLFGIISVVAANPGIKQGAAGEVLGIQRANMVALITELVDQGLVERHVSREDRRAFALMLSEAGRAKLEECLVLIRAHEEEMLTDLDIPDRARLIALLMKIEARER
uniref:MarR family winged helix-turn-helix transcriptional regulator n=1 Tax=Sphingomonas bacterium TaxID=1895847 RepID=UPI002602E1C5|nr:MarR family transcriptional regulator [Sphingomonas bacterium]